MTTLNLTFVTDACNKAEKLYKNINNKYLPQLKNNINDNKYKILVIAGSIITGCSYPLLSLIGAVAGYFLSAEFQPNPSNILTTKNSIAIISGAVGSAMPTCTLSALAVVAGTIGLGNLIYNAEKTQSN